MNPTPEQVEYLKRACGTRRFIYNWGREQWEKQYQAYKLGTGNGSRRAARAQATQRAPPSKSSFMPFEHKAYPWTYEVTKCVVEGAFDYWGGPTRTSLRGGLGVSQVQ